VDSSTPEAGVAPERAIRVVKRTVVMRIVELGFWIGGYVAVSGRVVGLRVHDEV
jgi:hypothetical protein